MAALGSWVVNTAVSQICHSFQQGEDPVLVFQVKMGCGFIQEQDPGLLGQGPGNMYQLAFPAADLSHRFTRQIFLYRPGQ